MESRVRIPYTQQPSAIQSVFKEWQEELSQAHHIAADLIANPSQYSEYFPGYQEALALEESIQPLYQMDIQASEYCKYKDMLETGCKVVLSSSWRSSRESDNAFTQYVLKLKGFKYELYGVTPRIWAKEFGTQRGEEIKLWMDKESEKNEIESFVILDDDSDILPDQMSNFILVDRQVGLADKDVFTAIEILNR